MMSKISVFGGYGFVGSWFYNRHTKDSIRLDKYDYFPKTNNILSFISTVDNYNIKKNPYLDIDTNLMLLIELLENSKDKFGSDFVFNFISSWFVYGKTECPAKEDSYCNPTGFYSITKRAAEQMLISYCETFKIQYRILRLGNVIGVGDKKVSREKNALQYMVQQAALGNDIDYLYKGDFYRDFIDVRDCADAIHLVVTKGKTNQIYNIGNGRPVHINNTVLLAKNLAKSSSNISYIEVPEFHKIVQVKDMWLDVRKIESLGYSQKYSIENTIQWLVEHYQNE